MKCYPSIRIQRIDRKSCHSCHLPSNYLIIIGNMVARGDVSCNTLATLLPHKNDSPIACPRLVNRAPMKGVLQTVDFFLTNRRFLSRKPMVCTS